ncbi:hypothetical protein [Fundicoccus culcitae]|uniref:Uncharacterized protein n=1 Tax=Fundicoccus culcitae TaxID=2969821 RepID=A0ABY5P5J7_9LACT|nr:hypothetical protein [Fundicoccus culcitae]UUX33673.1 hypothetical protein NRE15_12305 [Fundicoccus culcitae]
MEWGSWSGVVGVGLLEKDCWSGFVGLVEVLVEVVASGLVESHF